MHDSSPTRTGTHSSSPEATCEYLVVGEVLVDVVRTASGEVAVHAGGSPGNVAYGLGRLGHPVAIATEVADDDHGALVRQHLGSAGVTILSTSPSSGRTATATAALDRHGSARYTFDLTWTLDGMTETPAFRHLHTGSVAAFVSPGADVVERAARQARPSATVSLDPNIRPMLIADEPDVLGRLRRLLALGDVVKVSDEDLRWLHPEEDQVSVARRWLTFGPSVVVVTLGAEGSIGVARSGVVTVPPVHVDVVDTVGAGDAYMAALLDGLAVARLLGAAGRESLRAIGTETLRHVLARSTLAAGITVSRAGAQPPTTAELEAQTGAGEPESAR